MKVILTEKFHPSRKGAKVELSDKFAELLIKDGKAIATDGKLNAKGKKGKEEEPQAPEPTNEPQAPETEANADETPVIE